MRDNAKAALLLQCSDEFPVTPAEVALPAGHSPEAVPQHHLGVWQDKEKPRGGGDAPAASHMRLELPRFTVELALSVDPVLPPHFDSTPNEARSDAELDEWWERPFAISRPDGTYEVRCLDGGAWDRSTWYGNAATLEEAAALAKEKLSSWQEMSSSPMLRFDVDQVLVVRMPRRPGREPEVLFEAADIAEAQHFLQSRK